MAEATKQILSPEEKSYICIRDFIKNGHKFEAGVIDGKTLAFHKIDGTTVQLKIIDKDVFFPIPLNNFEIIIQDSGLAKGGKFQGKFVLVKNVFNVIYLIPVNHPDYKEIEKNVENQITINKGCCYDLRFDIQSIRENGGEYIDENPAFANFVESETVTNAIFCGKADAVIMMERSKIHGNNIILLNKENDAQIFYLPELNTYITLLYRAKISAIRQINYQNTFNLDYVTDFCNKLNEINAGLVNSGKAESAYLYQEKFIVEKNEALAQKIKDESGKIHYSIIKQ